MAESVLVVPPREIKQNPDNPRLIFRERELNELEASIAQQGILVPLTVYRASDEQLYLLDGERRWRCALKLGLPRVPVIMLPEPTRLQNIMMMFAIHNAREDWDPLATALKLRDLEALHQELEGRPITETQLAQLASMTRGEVRRLKNILGLDQEFLADLDVEAQKPKSEQVVTVDHYLEATRGAGALVKQNALPSAEQKPLVRALITKAKTGVLKSTVEPRLLAKMARAVERNDVPVETVARVVSRLVDDPTFTVRDAFQQTVETADYEHTVELQANRLTAKLGDALQSSADFGASARLALTELKKAIDEFLAR